MLENLLRKAPLEVRQKLQNRSTEITSEEIQVRRIQAMNDAKGNLTGYDCPICKNKGVIHYLKDGYEFVKPCECKEVREQVYAVCALLVKRHRFRGLSLLMAYRVPWGERFI